MKQFTLTSLLAIGFGVLLLAFIPPKNELFISKADIPELGFPNEVLEIFKTSCFDCHIADAKSSKAKMKLNFSKWENLSNSKKINKLDKISKDVTEGKMPTKKYLKKYPDRKLSQEEIDIVKKWVKTETSKLMGEAVPMAFHEVDLRNVNFSCKAYSNRAY